MQKGKAWFVSVLSGDHKENTKAAPEKDSVVRKEDVAKILKQVKAQYDLEDVRPSSNIRSSTRAPPQKRKKTTGTSAEPKTTSTSTSERNEATSPPKDGIPSQAPAATSKPAQSTVTPSQPTAPLYPAKPSSNNASLSQPAVAPDTTMKKRKSNVLDATKISAEKGDFGDVTKLGPLKSGATFADKTALFSQGVDVELNMEVLGQEVVRVLRETLRSNSMVPQEFDADVEALATEVLLDLVSKAGSNMTDMTSTTIDGRRKTRTFLLLPTKRQPLNPESTLKTQREYVRTKSSMVGDFVRACLPGKTAH